MLPPALIAYAEAIKPLNVKTSIHANNVVVDITVLFVTKWHHARIGSNCPKMGRFSQL